MKVLSLPLTLLLSLPAFAQANPDNVVVAETFKAVGTRIAYDAARSRLVVSRPGEAAWEHDGTAWSLSSVVLPAGPMLYDPSSERILVVGTSGLTTYDGSSSSTQPFPQQLPLLDLVSDSNRGQLVGARYAPAGPLQGIDIVEFHGSTWSTAAQLPGLAVLQGMAFDPTRNTTVFALSRINPVTRELWEWDGSTLSGPFPQSVQRVVLAYDPINQQVLIGTSAGPELWNGTTVTPLPGVSVAAGYASAAICTDTVNHRVLALSDNSVWSWNGIDWAEMLPAPMPACDQAHFTFDTARGRAVLLGETASRIHAEWDGLMWHRLPIGPSAPPRLLRHGQAYDAARAETIVFGGAGSGSTGTSGDTYAWNGSNWRLAATTGPGPRGEAAMCYDTIRQRVVMIGGTDPANSIYYQDHWEWDGLTWTQVSTATPLQSQVKLGFDPSRNRLVAHTLSRTTFEYDGTAWNQIATLGPRITYTSAVLNDRNMTYDASNQELLLTGLDDNFTPTMFAWDGATWSQRSEPLGIYAFDPQSGTAVSWTSSETRVHSDTLAAATAYGNGCGGSSTQTSLVGFGRPTLGSGSFQLDLRADARVRPALVGFGTTQQNVPIGNNCSILVGNAITAPLWFTDGAGFARFPLPVPAVMALRGMTLQAQGAVLDPASPGSLALTQGLSLVLGN